MWIMSFLVYPGRKGATWKAPGIPDWGVALALVALLAACNLPGGRSFGKRRADD